MQVTTRQLLIQMIMIACLASIGSHQLCPKRKILYNYLVTPVSLEQPVVGDQSVCYELFPATPGGPEMSMLSPPPFGHQAGSATPIHAGP
jgi:hypothetical protein